MIDFPASPTTGQTFDPGTGIVYSYDGVAWNAMTTSTATARSKNLLINPAMMISQENGSTAVTVNAAYPVDQWQLAFGGVVGLASQFATTTPDRSGTGFQTTVTTAKASLAAGDYDMVQQPIEGLQIAELQWGTARAIPAVLRFNAVADTPGIYSFSISSGSSDETYLGTFTATSTFQTFVLPIPAVTVGTWAKDNTVGARLRFCHCCGTTNTGVLGWQSGNFFAGPGQINAAATASKFLYVADVGLYADPSATGLAPPFVIPEIVPEMAKCQRYYRQQGLSLSGYGGASGDIQSSLPLSPIMRIAATVSIVTAGSTTNAFSVNATAAVDKLNVQVVPTTVGQLGVYNRGYALNARM